MNLSSMLSNHPFWGILTLAVLVWYSTITVYVAVRGAVDIKHMLRNLKANHEAAETPATNDDHDGPRPG
jgi:hypothetical protein